MTPIDDDLKRLLERGLVILVATRNDALAPFVTRAWGARVHDDDRLRISLCIPRVGTARALDDLRANGRVAVSFGDQATSRAVQIKGRSVAIEDVDAAALERATEQFARFFDKAMSLGGPPPHGLFTTDLVSITIVAEEIFEQTPGPGAGKKVA